MQSAFILTLDTGDDTDLFKVADDVKDMVDGNEGLIVIDCKPYPHPNLYPTPPLGGLQGPTLPTG